MRDLTNLSWPETPFGADQRPFGKTTRMVAAFAIGWVTPPAGDPSPSCVSTVYLRITPPHCLTVAPDTLSFGFRTTLVDGISEVPELLGVLDRALVRARRHAAVLAGHDLDRDLAAIDHLTGGRLAGVTSVRQAWANRQDKTRGLALMLDTCHDLDPPPPTGLALDPSGLSGVMWRRSTGTVAERNLARCLALGVAAAGHLGRYRWEGVFDTEAALTANGWDVLAADATSPGGAW